MKEYSVTCWKQDFSVRTIQKTIYCVKAKNEQGAFLVAMDIIRHEEAHRGCEIECSGLLKSILSFKPNEKTLIVREYYGFEIELLGGIEK